MAALLIAWGVFSITVIAHEILGTRPPLPSVERRKLHPGTKLPPKNALG